MNSNSVFSNRLCNIYNISEVSRVYDGETNVDSKDHIITFCTDPIRKYFFNEIVTKIFFIEDLMENNQRKCSKIIKMKK